MTTSNFNPGQLVSDPSGEELGGFLIITYCAAGNFKPWPYDGHSYYEAISPGGNKVQLNDDEGFWEIVS